jgi:phosphoglucosamine mutase
VVFAKSTFPDELSLDGLKIVVDCANGAAYKGAPMILSELGAETFPTSITPDGTNINLNCGALHPEKAQQEVLEHGADLGISLDGDADRVILVDEKGETLDGDELLAIAAQYMIEEGKLRKNTIVTTVMSNMGLEKWMESIGGTMIRTRVGDRYVVETMQHDGYNLGGEQSGHLIFMDHTTTGDGMIAALAVIAMMLRKKKPLSLLKKRFVRFPQVLKKVAVTEKRPFDTMAGVTAAIRNAEHALEKNGRVLVRYSGTENVARVMIEGVDYEIIDDLAQSICLELSREIGSDRNN